MLYNIKRGKGVCGRIDGGCGWRHLFLGLYGRCVFARARTRANSRISQVDFATHWHQDNFDFFQTEIAKNWNPGILGYGNYEIPKSNSFCNARIQIFRNLRLLSHSKYKFLFISLIEGHGHGGEGEQTTTNERSVPAQRNLPWIIDWVCLEESHRDSGSRSSKQMATK